MTRINDNFFRRPNSTFLKWILEKEIGCQKQIYEQNNNQNNNES